MSFRSTTLRVETLTLDSTADYYITMYGEWRLQTQLYMRDPAFT